MTLDLSLIVARWLHVLAVSLLFGAALFPFYGLGKPASASDRALRELPRLLMWSAVLALISGIVWFVLVTVQTGAFGSLLGWIWVVRLALGAILIYLLANRRGAAHNNAVVIVSGALLVSLVGLGHHGLESNAAAAVRILADIVHLLASGVWVGALFVLVLLLASPVREQRATETQLVNEALMRFSN